MENGSKLFACNSEVLKYKVHQFKRLLQHKILGLSNMRELDVFLHPYHECFPEIYKLLKIFMTMSVQLLQKSLVLPHCR